MGQHARMGDTVAYKGWVSGSAHLTPGVTGEVSIGVAPRGDESEYHFQPAWIVGCNRAQKPWSEVLAGGLYPSQKLGRINFKGSRSH